MKYLTNPWVKKYGVLLGLVFSLAILAAAFAYEQFTGKLPCPLCWLQRGVFIALACWAVISLIIKRYWLGRWVALLGYLSLAVIGVGIAARHLYIKLNPASASCGLDVETLLSFFPLFEALKQILIGSADCAQAADLLYLPLPLYSLVGYLLVLLLAIAGTKKSP